MSDDVVKTSGGRNDDGGKTDPGPSPQMSRSKRAGIIKCQNVNGYTLIG